MQDVQAERWILIYVGDRHRDEGCGLRAVLQAFLQRLWVTSINLEFVGGRGLEVQRLLEEKQAKNVLKMTTGSCDRVIITYR